MTVLPGFLRASGRLWILLALIGCGARPDVSGMLARSASIADGQGSGLYLGDGRVLTCLHIIEAIGSRSVSVTKQGRRFEAEVVYAEPRLDLVLLDIQDVAVDGERRPDQGQDPPAPEWVDRSRIAVGSPVFLAGAPYGLEDSLLTGSVSHTARPGTDPAYSRIPFLQTQGLSFPGTSGGAVYLVDGRIVGINRATFGTRPGTGIGLVIPAGFVRAFLDQAESRGRTPDSDQ